MAFVARRVLSLSGEDTYLVGLDLVEKCRRLPRGKVRKPALSVPFEVRPLR